MVFKGVIGFLELLDMFRLAMEEFAQKWAIGSQQIPILMGKMV